jgi:aspartate-semialdehyde dehydrogenase
MTRSGFRIGIAGASSLLGQEILRVLQDRHFPVAHVSKFDSDMEEGDLPVLDLSGGESLGEWEAEGEGGGLDALFIAARPRTRAGEPGLGNALAAAGMKSGTSPTCPLIDAANALHEFPGRIVAIPSAATTFHCAAATAAGSIFISPHPATIVLARILLRLAARFSLANSVAQVFLPASDIGPRGIEELQKQTVSLLSFQKYPHKVFGAQLAFNVLGRLSGKQGGESAQAEMAIRQELRECLGRSAARPALHFCHAPIFYSLAVSIFVELKDKPAREAVAAALSGNGIAVRARSETAPSPVESAGSGEIVLDAVSSDPDRPGGYWLWAAVDNIRLAAENAVDIAQACLLRPQGPQQ